MLCTKSKANKDLHEQIRYLGARSGIRGRELHSVQEQPETAGDNTASSAMRGTPPRA